MKNYTLLVSSCDTYSDLWEPFFTLLKKYWPTINSPVYLISDSKKYTFEGFDIRCPLNYKNSNSTWSERLLKSLDEVKTEYVILLLDDFWLKESVNVSLIDKFVNYMSKDNNIGYICLRSQPGDTSDKPSNDFKELNCYGRKNSYRINAQVGLWRKSFLKKILRKHENAWQFEWYGSIRSNFYDKALYYIKPEFNNIFSYDSGGVVFRGKFIRSYIDYFTNNNISIKSKREIEDLDVMREIYSNMKQSKINFSYWINLFKSLMPKF